MPTCIPKMPGTSTARARRLKSTAGEATSTRIETAARMLASHADCAMLRPSGTSGSAFAM